MVFVLFSFIVIIITVSVSYSIYSRGVIENAVTVRTQTDQVLKELETTFLNIRQMDISARGYATIPEERFIFWSVEDARNANERNFNVLDSLFSLQGYYDPVNYNDMKAGFVRYVNLYEQMLMLLRSGDLDGYKALLYEDYGKIFWKVNERFTALLLPFEAQLNQKAELSYKEASERNIIIQVLFLTIILPTLVFVIFRLVKDARVRDDLLVDLERTNEKYLFNDGSKHKKQLNEILLSTIKNLRMASAFINEISRGNYEKEWEGLEEQKKANQHTLAGQLIRMKNDLKIVNIKNQEHIWLNEGLSEFSKIIRDSRDNKEDFSYKALRFLIEYTGSQQGNLFTPKSEEQGGYLHLIAWVAFDRKKALQKRVAFGEGLVGQVFLEGKTLAITEIPENYMQITSGLGYASPTSIVIIPLRYNNKIEAIVELASFKVFSNTQIDFLEKSGEFLAAAISNIESVAATTILVEQLQMQTKQMRSQEEELRQNMEELEIMQEHMVRKEKLLQQQINKLQTKE